MKDLNKLGLGVIFDAKDVASGPLEEARRRAGYVGGGGAGGGIRQGSPFTGGEVHVDTSPAPCRIGVGPVGPLQAGVPVLDGSMLRLDDIQAEADRRVKVEGGATGIRTSDLTEPVHVARMDVTGAGSVGIDLD